MVETKQFLEILKKYGEGKATREEEEFLRTYYNLFELEPDVLNSMEAGEKADLKNRMESYLLKEINVGGNTQGKKATYKLWPRIAAAILLVIGAGLFFFNRFDFAPRHSGAGQNLGLANNNIKPGGNKAYLTLANGKRLSLTDAANGALAKEAGVEITKTADGQVIYKATSDTDISGRINDRHPDAGQDPGRERTNYSNALNTIETPRGGQYQVRLPDGSKVWLNAASKLIYPVSFTGRGQRIVELSGEAYFEIFKNKLQPFVVKSKNQEVTVLGTHFNVNTYTDEPNTKTTLLEGSVRVNEAVLKPGQQATLTGNQIKVTPVNTELAVAWKNNQFMFESERIENVMRMIARWYNVDIVYVGPTTTDKFGGAISRFDNVSEVLKSLESTGKVHFRIEGQTIYVLK